MQPLSCSRSLISSNFAVKSIIFSQLCSGAFSPNCWKKPWNHISCLLAGLQLRVSNKKIIFLSYVVGTQKNHLNETSKTYVRKHLQFYGFYHCCQQNKKGFLFKAGLIYVVFFLHIFNLQNFSNFLNAYPAKIINAENAVYSLHLLHKFKSTIGVQWLS